MKPEVITRLATRLLGARLAAQLEFRLVPHTGPDAFTVGEENGSLLLTGNTLPALSAALNHYLIHCAHLEIPWTGTALPLPEQFPLPARPIHRTSWAKHRYFLNYCCYSYSLAFWRWEQWEPFIDWMALQSVTLPLSITGQEAVWAAVGQRLGLSGEAMNEFLPGPAYLPFGWMGCLDGWEGPLPQGWIAAHVALGQRILQRQLELGMTPVLQGFTGRIPRAIHVQNPGAKVHHLCWEGWETCLLDPLDPLFPKIAALFHEEQTRLFGAHHHYAADPFIEMVPPDGSPASLAALAQSIYGAIARDNPGSTWLLQGWPFHFRKEFWTPPRLQAFLNAIPDERLLVLDLHCESHPVWQHTDAFSGKPWLWGNVQSFGQNTVLSGAMDANGIALHEVRKHNPRASRLQGIAMVNEGLCENPAAYHFFFEQGWVGQPEQPGDLKEWSHRYATARYGKPLFAAADAWDLLVQTFYRTYRAEDSAVTRCPSLETRRAPASETVALAQALAQLLTLGKEVGQHPAYQFDLINFTRQFLSNLAGECKARFNAALLAADSAECDRLAETQGQLLRDLSELLAAHPAFRLDRWLSSAEAWGSTPGEKATLHANALRQITLWGDGSDQLRDYARKEWSGLIAHFYLPRWQSWFAFTRQALHAGFQPRVDLFRQQQVERELRWITHGETAEPSLESLGHPLALAQRHFRYYTTHPLFTHPTTP